MRKLVKNKWLYIVLALVLLVFFEGNVTKLSIADRAIIVGLSVDCENSQLVVNSQLVLPSNSPQTTRSGIYAVFESRGATIEDALSQLSERIGLETSLAHCMVLVLGSEVLARAEFSSMAYLLTEDKVPDKMYIVGTEEKAKKILQANVPVGEVSSFHLSKVLMSQRRSIGVNPVNIKEFFVKYYTEAGTNFMPIATRIPVDLPNLPHPSTPTDDEVYVMQLERTAVLNREGYKLTLNDDESKALSLITAKINKGSISIPAEGGGFALADILESSLKKTYDMDGKKVSYNLDLKVKISDRTEDYGVGLMKPLTESEAQGLAKKLEDDILQCFEKCKEQGVDVFNVYEGFYQKYGKRWKERAGEEYIEWIDVEPHVKIIKK